MSIVDRHLILRQLRLDLVPVGMETLELIGVRGFRVGNRGLIGLERRICLRLGLGQRVLRGSEIGLRRTDVCLSARDAGVGGRLCRLQRLLSVVKCGLRGVDLRLRGRNSFGGRPRLELGEIGLLLGERRLGLIDRRLRVGRVFLCERLPRGNGLPLWRRRPPTVCLSS